MTDRERLPYRRPRTSLEFEHNGHAFTGGAGYWLSGRVGEVFLSGGKPNSARDVDTKDAAIATSIALQHGATVDELRNAVLRNDDGTAAGPLGHLLDLIAGAAL